ncbi:hypothetical protein EI546_15045 [Aequorivita sp. H23M31]|uniref:Tetratricopeptide repeat protein n=1 Tax=Aequorivita ciconiae TaxID=2494375 RepID=A0A410G6Q5_9FLAO|nr:hypothetical protein [Aequorivita sp. H23M31]QAA82952.1 hypothetical protein EI546_15045 [Aequorivita sp. H23M31]
MQNVLTYLSLFLTILVMQGQTQPASDANAAAPTKYEKGMQEAFGLWKDNHPWEAANMFVRIAKAEPDNWLPPYYVALINVVYSFGEKDKSKLSEQLAKAQNFINDATALSPDNPDIMVVQAQLYTAWIVFDGQQYGMMYSPKASGLYEKALAIDPENPRTIMARAEWNIGSAKYFGEPVEAYCKDIERAMKNAETHPTKEEFYPRFNLERAKQVLAENCQ